MYWSQKITSINKLGASGGQIPLDRTDRQNIVSIKSFINKLLGRQGTSERLNSSDKSIPSPFTETKKSPLDPAWESFNKQDYDTTTKLAETFQANSNPDLVRESTKIIGLVKFRQGKFSESEKIFSDSAANSSDPVDWFNLMTSSTLNKNLDISKKAFNKAVDLRMSIKKSDISVPQIIYYYMLALRDIKEYTLAFDQFIKMADIYGKYGITDDTFLYMRGVPFFHGAIEQAKSILEHVSKGESEAVLSKLKTQVDEYGKEFLDKYQKELVYIG